MSEVDNLETIPTEYADVLVLSTSDPIKELGYEMVEGETAENHKKNFKEFWKSQSKLEKGKDLGYLINREDSCLEECPDVEVVKKGNDFIILLSLVRAILLLQNWNQKLLNWAEFIPASRL